MKNFFKLLILPCVLIMAGCAGDIGADNYETSAAGQVNSASAGVVVAVRQVKVATSDGSVGTLAGGVAGGAAGSMIGGNPAVNVIGAVGGALLGGMIGNAAQDKLSEQIGYEYIIKLDSGNLITITQGRDNALAVGQRCIVLNASRGERARVIAY